MATAINDFHRLLINDDTIQRDAFWGKYKLLNTLPSQSGPDMSQIYFNLQVQQLRTLEQSSNAEKYKETNKFLTSLNEKKVQVESINNEIIEMTENQVISRILQIFNLGFESGGEESPIYKARHGSANGGWKIESTQQATKLIVEITQLLQAINVSQPLSQQIIDMLEARFKTYGQNSFYDYKKEKSAMAEELLTDIMSSRGRRTLTTGSWLSSGKQLLEDNITYLQNLEFKSENSFVLTTVNGTQEIKLKSLDELFQLAESLTGEYKISIPDDIYQMIQNSDNLMSQVKSGMNNQHILNVSNEGGRNTISIKEISSFFSPRGLWSLYNSPNTNYFFGDGSSLDLDGYANLALSKGIAMTNLKRNQLYLTEKGITTASQWMELTKQFLKFKNPVNKLGNDFMSLKRPYYFTTF